MSYDVVIEIMGQCDDASSLREIVEAAGDDAAERDWGYSAEDEDILEAIRAATENRGMLALVKSDTLSLFNETRKACQRAGLHYIVSYGPRGEEGFSEGVFYRVGGDEFQVPLDVGSEVIPMRDVREAVKNGFEAVQEMVAEYDRKVLKDIPRELGISPEALADLAAVTGAKP